MLAPSLHKDSWLYLSLPLLYVRVCKRTCVYEVSIWHHQCMSMHYNVCRAFSLITVSEILLLSNPVLLCPHQLWFAQEKFEIQCVYICMFKMLITMWACWLQCFALIYYIVHVHIQSRKYLIVYIYFQPSDQRKWRRVASLPSPTGMMCWLRRYIYTCTYVYICTYVCANHVVYIVLKLRI